MSKNQYRIAVVGAASLLGKEVADEIAESPLASATTLLLDNEVENGTLEAVGDEATFIQTLDTGSLENVDVAIFTDNAALREHGRTARQMGVAVVDATGHSDVLPDAPVLAPQMLGAAKLNLESTAVRVAHPVASALALLLRQVTAAVPVRSAFATVLQPASEMGRKGVDELQGQSVSLLSFQSTPKEQFDAQVAFNLLPALGESAAVSLDAVAERIQSDLKALSGEGMAAPLLHVIQTPVFHGYGVSLFLELDRPVAFDAFAGALQSEHFDLVGDEGDPPSNLSSAGQPQVLLRITPSTGEPVARYAVWMTFDNLKLRARTAVACALELTRLRPLGSVQ